MRMSGKVISFDGYVGLIMGIDNEEYMILKNEIVDNIKINDMVIFEPEVYEDLELKKRIARFIKLNNK